MNVDVAQLFQLIGELYVENRLLKAQPSAEVPAELAPLSDEDITAMKGILDE